MFYHSKWYCRAAFALPVIIVLALYLGLYYCFIYGFVMASDLTVWHMVMYLLFHIVLFLCVWAYLKTVMTDPGSIPPNFDMIPDEERFTNQTDYLPEDYMRSKSTYCRKCQRKRPARTHHCSVCDRCVMRMDHHCPWVGNCVGFFNHKYFLQFLWYAFIDCVVVAASNGYILFFDPVHKNYFTLLGAIGGLSISLAVAGLGCFHLWLLLTNRNCLELGSFAFNVFDTGSLSGNFKQICGTDWKLWFLPVKGPGMGDGVFYPVKLRNKDGSIEYIVDKILS
mmetsp:Transcript_28599/g.50854  ORF Transcript_28599/g.50854 Transcript_28599/m.50854 type:complete len:280 (-) Transcript_28599:15-854(-)